MGKLRAEDVLLETGILPSNGSNGLTDVRCPQLAFHDLVENNQHQCNDPDHDYSHDHVYWDIFLAQLPSGIDWGTIWANAG